MFQALREFCETVNSVSSHARFWLEREGRSIWFCRAGIEGLFVGENQAELYVVATMTQLVRLGAGHDWVPDTVQLKADRAPRDEFPPGFAVATIQCSRPRTAIRVGAGSLARSIEPRPGSPTVHNLRGRLSSVAPSELPDIHEAAELIGCSPRTLQRILAADGLTWRRVLDQTRFRWSLEALTLGNRTLLDVALDCGYSDQAHFTRAFRRWTGSSPGAYRHQVLLPS